MGLGFRALGKGYWAPRTRKLEGAGLRSSRFRCRFSRVEDP